MTTSPIRHRLPNRRAEILIGNMVLLASVGFNPDGRPQELFLSGAKDGSGMAAILEDASVVITGPEKERMTA